MNHISKTHNRFSQLLRNPRVLTNPEEFLGPDFKEVLNFWLIIDVLSEEQFRIVNELYDAFDRENLSEWWKATGLACEASEKVVNVNSYNAGWAAYDFTNSWAAFFATKELIGMHLILEQQPLTFLPMVLEVL